MRTGRTGQLKALNLDASKVLLRLWPVVSKLTTGQPPNGAEYGHFRGRHRTVDAFRYTHVPYCVWRGGTGKLGRAERPKKA